MTLVAGKLLMITFAVGIVTGLVQEFQFGLSWSDFARFYGDVFGPTLAIEGMLAFFLEATFLGLWWFGADRLRPALHLATIWIVAVGTLISAYVILAANAFMQNPVAYTLDPVTGRARLGDFTDLLTNEVVLAAFPHTIAGAFLGGGALLLAIGGFRRWRSAGGDATGQWRLLVRVGAWTTLVSGTAVALTGDLLGKVMTSVQPMKMAAAEALYATQAGAPFSLFAVGAPGDTEPFFTLDVPWLLSFLATGDPTATVQGIDDLQAQYVAQFGPGDYVPVVPMAYWSFRFMIGFGVVATIVAAWVLWRMRRGRDLSPGDRGLFALVDRWLLRGLWVVPVLPAARRDRRLDVHRDRPPALARLRPVPHRRRGLARADTRRDRRLAGRVRRGLRPARRRLGPARAAGGPAPPRDDPVPDGRRHPRPSPRPVLLRSPRWTSPPCGSPWRSPAGCCSSCSRASTSASGCSRARWVATTTSAARG